MTEISWPSLPSEIDVVKLKIEAASLVPRCTFPEAGTPIHCAVSGGADSLALLALAVAAGCLAVAHHVEHGLRAGTENEPTFVAQFAEMLGAEFVSHTVDVESGPNVEARARVLRYSVLPIDIATGHTADDIAETMLINLARGSGVDGLAPMRGSRVQRPMRRLRRAETRRFCEQLGIVAFDDPMNADLRFQRVRMRAEVLPLLSSIASRDVVPLFVRLAETAADDIAVLDEQAALLDPTDAVALRRAPRALARRAIRHWLVENGVGDGHPPSLAVVDRVLSVASQQAVRSSLIEGWTVARTKNRLRLEREQLS